MNPRNPGNPDDETRYIGPTSGGSGSSGDQGRPRQYFPGEHDPNFRYDPAYDSAHEQPYEEPYAPSSAAPAPAKKSGGALPMLLGILFGLTLLAAIAFFFLWRGAAAEADREPPAPVTVTSTVERTVTTTEDAPALPTEIPTEIPSDIVPSDLPEIDIEGWLNELTGGAPEPAP